MSSILLTSKQLSERWSITPETLRTWRFNATGPLYIKLNGRIRYRVEDIEQFEREHLRRHTAEGVLIRGMEGRMAL